MAFDESVFLNLEGGLIQPITHVTANFSPSNVVVYDGDVYRNELDAAYLGRAWASNVDKPYSTAGVHQTTSSNDNKPEATDDRFTATAPIYKGKQRTLWSFGRTISGVAGYTHVCWSDQVISSGDFPAFRVGTASTVV